MVCLEHTRHTVPDGGEKETSFYICVVSKVNRNLYRWNAICICILKQIDYLFGST